ncbi:hypothetical protein ACIQNU_40890 [Streptomyces sp. NPDC091292]|uniref:hypothetical protein n=1 Tax=Streptomyces sp. NPDC091292 TaxID=3365991 RepID=UPI0038289F09
MTSSSVSAWEEKDGWRMKSAVRGVAVAAAVCLLVAGESGARRGQALNGGIQTMGTLGNSHVKVGDIWWVAFPELRNSSSVDIVLTGVEMTHVPAGLKVLEYGAFDRSDTEGVPLLAREGASQAPRFDRLTNYVREEIRVKAGKTGDIFYMVRLEATGPIKGNLQGCRYEYQQGSARYEQTLGCDTALRLEKD